MSMTTGNSNIDLNKIADKCNSREMHKSVKQREMNKRVQTKIK